MKALTFAVTHDDTNRSVLEHVMDEVDNVWLMPSFLVEMAVYHWTDELSTSGIWIRMVSLVGSMIGKRLTWKAWFNSTIMFMVEAMRVVEANDDLMVFVRGDKGIVVINKSKRSKTASLTWTGHNGFIVRWCD